MIADIERLAVDAINVADLGAKAYYDVPDDRPETFVTVVQTDGPVDWKFVGTPTLDVECWAKTRRDATLLADSVAETLMALEEDDPNVFRVEILSTIRDDDIDSDAPRRVLSVQITYAI